MSHFPYPPPYSKLSGPRNIKNSERSENSEESSSVWALGCRVLGKVIIILVTLEYQPCLLSSFSVGVDLVKKMSRFLHTTLLRLKAAFLVRKSRMWVRRKRSFHGNAPSGWDQEVITWSPQGGLIFFLPPFTATKRLKQGFLSLGSLESVLLLTTWGLL